MKKLLLLGVLVISSLCASAQHYIGGSLGVMRDFTDHEFDVTVAPDWGYTFSEHWGLGLTLDYTYKHFSDKVSNAFSFAPYARLTYARVADDKLSFFVDGGFGLGFASQKNTTSAVFYNVGFKPGLAYNFNEHWSVVTHIGFLGYQGANSKAKALGYHEKLGLDFSSMNLNFGLYYTF